ncbi:protein ABIL1-like [Carica papaya]|uniref:protein ABIL1-like n=1 Tax=Carica papaya TaxID=3649 RepID=UPI000B8C9FF6|nr:protein ABIL1-like [Carica papaya]
MHIFELSSADYQEPDGDQSKEDFQFCKSLQELKDLRSQLHYAADYCKATFCKAGDKKMVVENTKNMYAGQWLLL